MISEALYKFTKEDWGTPSWLFVRLNAIYDFRLDAATSTKDALCQLVLTRAENELEQDWLKHKRVWLNSPDGRKIGQ